MSPEYVLPMSPEYSVTYVPGRFEMAEHIPTQGVLRDSCLAPRLREAQIQPSYKSREENYTEEPCS